MATERMEVTDWRDSPPPIIPPANARSRFLSPTLVGVLGTLLLHAMFIQTVVLGGHGLKPKRPEIPESSSTLSKSADTETELVVLSLPATTSSNQVIQESALSMLPDLSKVKIKAPIDVVPPESLDLETLALSEDLPSNQGAGAAAGTEQARLFGIYTGQIQARIDRVWRRPRTPVNENNPSASDAESFQCEAQIVQDQKGNVQEILLPRCNGSAAWQHSLVVAIQQASPLPAPPSEKTFRKSVSLNFIGLQYFAGASDDEYEFAARPLTGKR